MARLLALLLLALLPVGCRSKPTAMLRDTEGRTIAARCDEGRCELVQRSGPKPAGAAFELAVVDLGHLVAVCDVASGATRPQAPEQCRPLVCQSDAECPPDRRAMPGQCLSGVCVDPTRELGVDDAVALCLAGTGLGCETPNQLERRALALNCGVPCRLPKPCRALAHLGPPVSR